MEVLERPTTLNENSLQLGRSLSSMKDDVQCVTIRIQQRLTDTSMLGTLLASLKTLSRMNGRVQLSLQLLLEPSTGGLSINEKILNGDIEGAYKSFLKGEKCRNDLLNLCEDENDEEVYQFIAERLSHLDENNEAIRNVIQTTLFSDTETESNIQKQILDIIKTEQRLDAISVMLKNKGKKGLLNRPRNWCQSLLHTLNTQKTDENTDISDNSNVIANIFTLYKYTTKPMPPPSSWVAQLPLLNAQKPRVGLAEDVYEVLSKRPEISESELNRSAFSSLLLNEQDEGYHEELVTIKRYFTKLHEQQQSFEEELEMAVPIKDILESAQGYLTNEDFLAAYEKLADAETTRLQLLDKCKNTHDVEFVQAKIEKFFEPVESVYDDYKQKAKYYCIRALDIIRNSNKGPRKILSAILSAVEIDENFDALYIRKKITIKDRPHCWRLHFFKIIETSIHKRIEVFQIEDKTINKDWITKYLEICRMFIVDDLVATKRFLASFPKEHQLYDRFVLLYHQNICNKLSEIAASNLNERECIQLLHWINEYTGEGLLGNPCLQINVRKLVEEKPLIPKDSIHRLHDVIIKGMEDKVGKLGATAIQQEFNARIINLTEGIEEDGNGYYYTNLPYLLFSIVSEQVNLAKSMDKELVPRVLGICLDEFLKHVAVYESTVAITNDLEKCQETTESLRKYIPDEVATTSVTGSGDDSVSFDETLSDYTVTSSNSTSSRKDSNTSTATSNNSAIATALRSALFTLTEITAPVPATTTSSTGKQVPNVECKSVVGLSFDAGLTPSTPSSIDEPKAEHAETSSLFGLNLRRKRTPCAPMPIHLSLSQKIDLLKEGFEGVSRMTVSILLQEVTDDLDEFFDKLLTKQWLKKADFTDTICLTLMDYYSDHRHLYKSPRLELQMCILFRYVSEYLSAIASRRLTGTPYDKRCKISNKLSEDVQKIRETFKPLYNELNSDNSISPVTDLLLAIGSLLKLKSKDMIRLEIGSLVRDFPGMPQDLLHAIINTRDDVTSNESWELVNECMEAAKGAGNPILVRVYQMAKPERKTSQILMEMVPRFKRRVKISMAH